jgi:serine/threonine protein phosphatase PrpC
MIITAGTRLGNRPYQEDRFSILEDDLGTLVSVFDGHGGETTVDKCFKDLPEIYKKTNPDVTSRDRIRKIYALLDELTKDDHTGSTASLAYITPTEVVLAVLGDSPVQALLSGEYPEFTMPEHNVRSNVQEASDIIGRGGVISNGYVFKNFGGPGLQMSRALGDAHLYSILNQKPQTVVIPRWKVKSILVATDGLIDPAHAKNKFLLATDSTAEVLLDSRTDFFDNATAVVIHLNQT